MKPTGEDQDAVIFLGAFAATMAAWIFEYQETLLL
jgi:hypothetical protein